MQQIEFQLNSEYVELNQLLKMVGLCDSGGAGKAMVAEGVVSVDGQQELRKTAKIRAGAVVTLGDVAISVVAANGAVAE
jgi:ribosome-associated protein